MKKIKWKNILKAIVLAVCTGVIAQDFYVLVSSFAGFTLYGLATHLLTWCVGGFMFNSLQEEFNARG